MGISVSYAPSAAVLAADLAFTGAFAPKAFSGCSLTKSATQSIADSTFGAISFNGETYDTSTYHDNATNNTRITVPTTGYYRFTGSVAWATIAGPANFISTLYKNGSEIVPSRSRLNQATGADVVLKAFHDLLLTAGDYVELMGRQTTGGAVNATADCVFQCQFLGT